MEMTERDTDITILHDLKRVNEERAKGNFDNSLPKVSVQIPESMKVACPKFGRRDVIVVSKCLHCDSYGGVVQKTWNNESQIPWAAKYAIVCSRPLDRSVTEMVI